MTEIYFIRHGQTAQNTAKRFQGHSDTELDATGRGQAQRIAERLAQSAIAAVYTSDLTRARQTAEAIAARVGAPLVSRSDLREIDVGKATGMSKEELMTNYPDLFSDDWHQVRFPNGESYHETGLRMTVAAREIAASHPDQLVAAISHGGAIRSVIAELVGFPIDTLRGLFVTNTSITRIAVDRKGRGRLLALNDAAHLEDWYRLRDDA
jgi:broad specificity phosphatase PhoE